MVRMMFITLAVLLFLLIGIGVGAADPDKVKEVREKHEKSIMETEGVTGLYLDEEEGVLVVMVEEEKQKEKIPKEIDGVKVKVEVTGRIYALGSGASETATVVPLATTYNRFGWTRPVFGGVSAGNPDIPLSAGTLGLVVEGTGEYSGLHFALSNAHVFSLDDNAGYRQGDIWQPGGYDQQSDNPARKMGVLWRSGQIIFNSYNLNLIDASIGQLDTDAYDPSLTGKVLDQSNTGFYLIRGTAQVKKNQIIRKSGRTTGVTTGKVVSPKALIRVYYTDTKWALFTDQIMATDMSDPGDSGSAVDYNGKFVGLVFAGSNTNTFICKAQNILNYLWITV